MRRYTPLFLSCALLSWYADLARPFVISPGARLVNRPRHSYGASVVHAAAEPPRPNNMKMSNPSTPVPRNIKDTVSCLRAAVQVCVIGHPVVAKVDVLMTGCSAAPSAVFTIWKMFQVELPNNPPVLRTGAQRLALMPP